MVPVFFEFKIIETAHFHDAKKSIKHDFYPPLNPLSQRIFNEVFHGGIPKNTILPPKSSKIGHIPSQKVRSKSHLLL